MTQLFSGFGNILLTISSGQDESNTLDCRETVYDAEALNVAAPAALDALTYSWEVSIDGGVSFQTLQDASATDIKVPAAGKAIVYNGIFTGITHLRIAATGNAAEDRVFKLSKAWRA